jgi:hypothetical protein
VIHVHSHSMKSSPSRIAALSFLLLLLALHSAPVTRADEKSFVEVRSPNFRVLTDASDREGRRIANEFEQMRSVFAVGFPNMRLTTGAPLLIFAVQNENAMKALAPAFFPDKAPKPAGMFNHGWEKQFAIVRLDQDVPGAYQVVYHEYVHSLLHSNLRWLPNWLDEGLAEYYGNTRFEGKKMYVGAPSRRVYLLQRHKIIPLETLLVVNPHAYFRGKQDEIDTFYAESWALVHFLVFGPSMEQGKKLAQFYNRLQLGDEQLKAFREIFGDMRAFETALDKYIRAFAFQSYVLDNSASALHEKDFSSRKLSVAESQAALAELRLWNHDTPEAIPLVEAALKDDPNLALAHEEKAFLAFHNGQDEEAAREFSRASELDKQRYLSQYFSTMLAAQRETLPQRDALRANLRQTAQIDPLFAPAYIQLAILELADGRNDAALALSRKAESLEPSRAGYHLLSGEILLRLQKEKEAADFAKFVADRWRGPDHNEAVALWNRIPPQSRPPDANVVVEIQEQSQTAEGVVRSVTCEEKTKNIVLDSNGQSLTFHSKGRQLIGIPDTVWYGSDHFDLCYHVVGMHAVVRYRPPVGTEYTGDWLSIELRDELPSPRDNLKESIENKN